MKILVLMTSDYDGEYFQGIYAIPDNMNVELEEDLFEKSGLKIKFSEWLLFRGAREATEEEAIVYYHTDY